MCNHYILQCVSLNSTKIIQILEKNKFYCHPQGKNHVIPPVHIWCIICTQFVLILTISFINIITVIISMIKTNIY